MAFGEVGSVKSAIHKLSIKNAQTGLNHVREVDRFNAVPLDVAAGLVDEVHAYIAPVLLGSGKSAVGNFGVATITEALRLDVTSTHVLGPDILMIGRPIAPDHTPRARSTDQEQ